MAHGARTVAAATRGAAVGIVNAAGAIHLQRPLDDVEQHNDGGAQHERVRPAVRMKRGRVAVAADVARGQCGPASSGAKAGRRTGRRRLRSLSVLRLTTCAPLARIALNSASACFSIRTYCAKLAPSHAITRMLSVLGGSCRSGTGGEPHICFFSCRTIE